MSGSCISFRSSRIADLFILPALSEKSESRCFTITVRFRFTFCPAMPTCSWSCASLLSNKGKQFIYSVEMFLRIFFPAVLAGVCIALPGRMGACVLKCAGVVAAWGISVCHYFSGRFMLSLLWRKAV